MASVQQAAESTFRVGLSVIKHPYFRRAVTTVVAEAALLHFTLNPLGKFYVVQRRLGKPFIVRKLYLRIPFLDKVLDTIYDTHVTTTESASVRCGDVRADVTIELTARYNPPHRSEIWLGEFTNGEILRLVIKNSVHSREINPSTVIDQDEVALRNQLNAAIEQELGRVHVDVMGTHVNIQFVQVDTVDPQAETNDANA
jgi:hypothetical protein